MEIQGWMVKALGEPMVLEGRGEEAGPGEVLVEVAGCGVCHTDLGYYYDGVPTRHPLPLVLGHEISGEVVAAGEGAESWLGAKVVVPAVIPCGECEACRDGRGSICPRQVFPGNDDHGGFATHVKVPARGLCRVPELEDSAVNPKGLRLSDLAVVADAISTPYQALLRSGLREGDLAVFLGCGGVGGFGVQIAKSMGAKVVAVDVDPDRLEAMRACGADLCVDSSRTEFKAMKKEIRAFAKEHGVPTWRRRIFETSGHPKGQEAAFGLLEHGGFLSVVGYTPRKVEVRFSNLMALDATAQGNWGCLPEHYPAVVDLVLSGGVSLEGFIEHRSLSTINETFEEIHEGRARRRVILEP